MKKFLLSIKAKKRKGFTLVELIVVMAIIAILAAIAIPAYANVQEGAQKSATKANATMVVRSINMYNILNPSAKVNSVLPTAGKKDAKTAANLTLGADYGNMVLAVDLTDTEWTKVAAAIQFSAGGQAELIPA